MKTYPGSLEYPSGEERRYPARHDVRDAELVSGVDRVAVVAKRVRRRWFERDGTTSAERAVRVAMYLLRNGVPTPEPLGIEVGPRESCYVSRRVQGACQIRWWFLRRDDPSLPDPLPGLSFERILSALGALVRRLHDGGVFFGDLTDGNVLVSPAAGGGFELWLVDLSRARIGQRPLGWPRRVRDLATLGLNLSEDRKLLLRAYTSPAEPPSWAGPVIAVLRKRTLWWDAAKRVLRPWRG